MIKQQLLWGAVILSVLLLGCGPKTPAGLPKLYPCKVKIVDKSGAPVENVTVVATQAGSIWAGIGLTDADGIAMLKTNGIYPGVPVGTYKIATTKYDVVVIKSGREEVSDKITETLVFDKSFSNEGTTPLEMTVEAKKNNDVTFTVF